MEGRSGFKECPRCGLRNRMSAVKCDFCGFEFQDSSEEWSDYVDVLERLSKSEEMHQEDEDLSRKIESTLVKPVENVVSSEAPVAEKEGSEIPVPKEESDVTAFVDSMIEDEVEEASPPVVEREDLHTMVSPSLEYTEDLETEPEGKEEGSDSNKGAVAASMMAATLASDESRKVFQDEEGSAQESTPVSETTMEVSREGAEEAPIQEQPESKPIEEELASSIIEEEVAPSILEEEVAIPEVEAESISEEPIRDEFIDEDAEQETLEDTPQATEVAVEAAYSEEIIEVAPLDELEVKESKATSPIPFIGLLGAGIIIYLVALGGQMFLALDVTVGWSLAIIGSLILIFGFRQFYDRILPVSDARRGKMGA